MTSNRLCTALLAALVFAGAGHAADDKKAPKPERSEVPAKKASAPPGGGAGDLTKKYCCSSPSGKACYVFGSASCSNCNTFCKGDIIVQ